VTDGPLAGRRILVTRRPEQSGALVAALRAAGASVVELPLIVIAAPEDWEPLDRALRRLHVYDWLVFTSANAVRAVRDRLERLGLSAEPVGKATTVASVGEATSAAFAAAFPGGVVSLAPASQFRSEGLLEAFLAREVAGQRFLIPSSDQAAETLPAGLRTAGGEVDSVAAYRTVTPPDLAPQLAAIFKEGLDMALFASPSAVAGFAAAAGPAGALCPAGVIGPVTRARAETLGLDVRVEARPSTDAGMLEALLRHFAPLS
jgi:uroporphyrinogen III methyltransferase/synthase